VFLSKGDNIMFAYLINLGFTEKQIVDYVRSTDYSLDQLTTLSLN